MGWSFTRRIVYLVKFFPHGSKRAIVAYITEKTMNILQPSQRIAVLLFVLTLVGPSSSAAASPLPVPDEETAKLFAYDRSRALDLKEVSAKEQDGVTVRDVDYAAYTSTRGRIKAFLVEPAGKGPFAGVLFFHWYGRPKGNREQFLDEAIALAKQGTISVLIQGYFPWGVAPVDAQTDRQRVIDETIEVRRALDLLLSSPKVDRKRIAFVGHDYGARTPLRPPRTPTARPLNPSTRSRRSLTPNRPPSSFSSPTQTNTLRGKRPSRLPTRRAIRSRSNGTTANMN
jgi:hypothetical protein